MVSVPVVSVNEISSVTVAAPSMTIVSEPVGSILLLQFDASDQTPVAPPSHNPLGQTFTGWFPIIEPVVTPVQSSFIVPMVLLMVPDVLLMAPELLMVPASGPFELRMPLPPVFDTVMVPELVMVPPFLMPSAPEF